MITTHPMRGTTSRALVIIASLLLFTACGPAGNASNDPLDGTAWELTAVWHGSALAAIDPTVMMTAVFGDGTVAGSDGCNDYRLDYTVDGTGISLRDLVISGRSCEPSTPQSDAFITALQTASGFTLTDENLELTDASGGVLLNFRPAEQLPLSGITWWLERYAVPSGGLAEPLVGTRISVAFRNDGTLVGIAGCNDYSADFQADGDALTLGPIAATERGCLDPDGVMAQEAEYLSVLSRVDAFETSLTGLRLLDDAGNTIAEYRFGGRVR